MRRSGNLVKLALPLSWASSGEGTIMSFKVKTVDLLDYFFKPQSF
jgi:hypothetical protein